MRRNTLLFDESGEEHTEETLEVARDRALELGIQSVVFATSTGKTALKAAATFENSGAELLGVTLHAGTWDKYAAPDPEMVQEAEAKGVEFLTATHTLMGHVGSAIREKFGGIPPAELIAHTYYSFSQGMKVAVEIALMAADAGSLEGEEEIISVAGSGSGADTAIVLAPAYSTSFFDLNICEILAMPRS